MSREIGKFVVFARAALFSSMVGIGQAVVSVAMHGTVETVSRDIKSVRCIGSVRPISASVVGVIAQASHVVGVIQSISLTMLASTSSIVTRRIILPMVGITTQGICIPATDIIMVATIVHVAFIEIESVLLWNVVHLVKFSFTFYVSCTPWPHFSLTVCLRARTKARISNHLSPHKPKRCSGTAFGI